MWTRRDRERRLYYLGGIHYAHAARSYASWNELSKIKSLSTEIFEIFEKVFNISFEVRELRSTSYRVEKEVFYVKEGKEVPLGCASGFANSIFQILVPIAHSKAYGKEPEVLLEEPELYMHPKYQYLMSIALFLLASKLERLVVLTHSIHVLRGLRHAYELSRALKVDKGLETLRYLKDLIYDIEFVVNELKRVSIDFKVFLFEDFEIKEIDMYDEDDLKEIMMPEARVELSLPEVEK